MAIGKMIREGIKFSTSGAIQMMLGGIVTMVMPPQVSIPYKIATSIGSVMIAWFAGEKMDDFVEKKLDDIEEAIDTVKAMAAEVKKDDDIVENSEEA